MKKYIFTKDKSIFPIPKTKTDNNVMPAFGQSPPVNFTRGEIIEGNVTETNFGGIKSTNILFKTKKNRFKCF